MGKVNCTAIILAAIVVFLGIGTLGHEAYAQKQKSVLACYFWSAFPNERLKLNIELHSPLSEPEEEKKFGHPRQTVFSVHGKEVGGCGGNTMAAVTGTVVTAKGGGAHMGVVAHFSRATGGVEFCRSFTFDCTTEEDGPAPDNWRCHSRNEWNVFHGASTLRRVDETQDPRCSIFENGSVTQTHAQAQRYVPDQRGSAGMPGRARISGGRPPRPTFPLQFAPFGQVWPQAHISHDLWVWQECIAIAYVKNLSPGAVPLDCGPPPR